MTVADLRLLDTERGRKSVDQTIAGGTTATISIPLKRSDFDFGSLILYLPYSVSDSRNRRSNANIVFTKVLTDAVAQATHRRFTVMRGYTGPAYSFTNWSHKGYFYSDDATLSNSFFNDGSASSIRVHSARINGSSLELAFKNMSVGTSILNLEIEYRVFQVHNKA